MKPQAEDTGIPNTARTDKCCLHFLLRWQTVTIYGSLMIDVLGGWIWLNFKGNVLKWLYSLEMYLLKSFILRNNEVLIKSWFFLFNKALLNSVLGTVLWLQRQHWTELASTSAFVATLFCWIQIKTQTLHKLNWQECKFSVGFRGLGLLCASALSLLSALSLALCL